MHQKQPSHKLVNGSGESKLHATIELLDCGLPLSGSGEQPGILKVKHGPYRDLMRRVKYSLSSRNFSASHKEPKLKFLSTPGHPHPSPAIPYKNQERERGDCIHITIASVPGLEKQRRPPCRANRIQGRCHRPSRSRPCSVRSQPMLRRPV